jgi:hypothetical protein
MPESGSWLCSRQLHAAKEKGYADVIEGFKTGLPMLLDLCISFRLAFHNPRG